MKLESRHRIHVGINFVFTPAVILDKPNTLRFQEYLDDAGIELTAAQYTDQSFMALRQPKIPIQITVANVAPQAAQLLIVAPEPGRPVDSFASEVEDVIKVFQTVWPAKQRQLLGCDTTIRDLYDTSSEHAFKELWEGRLHQVPDSLKTLGPGLVGGGLRFVLAAIAAEAMSPVTEIKIESFLQDSSKLFLEATYQWPSANVPGAPFEATRRIEALDTYINQQVVGFIQEGQS